MGPGGVGEKADSKGMGEDRHRAVPGPEDGSVLALLSHPLPPAPHTAHTSQGHCHHCLLGIFQLADPLISF